ncbi:CheW protein [Bacillus freudenreichii]|nr:CheW protein [Bacillus freudenreichii]
MSVVSQEQYVAIGIGTEKYAIRIHDIEEIIRMQDITKIPNVQAHIKGVINLRGRIIPVVSLRHRFGLNENEYTKDTRIVVVKYADEMIGIVVDSVSQVTMFSEIQQPPETLGDSKGSFFSGIGKVDDELVSILNLDKVLQQ